MRKLILKIISVIAAFILGIVFMGHMMSSVNRDQTETMAGAGLPLVSLEKDGRAFNTMHGYIGEIDGSSIRGDVFPMPEDRTFHLAIEAYGTDVDRMYYEVRTTDYERLIESEEISYSIQTEGIEASFQLKDLFDPGEEYALILHLEIDDGREVSYFGRIANLSSNRMDEALAFADKWHAATFDKNNTLSMSGYLEPDRSMSNDSFELVTIHSRYKQVIWDQLDMQPYSDVRTYITAIDPAVTSIRLDYTTVYEEEEQQPEYFRVSEYFRIRCTDTRNYLLDYNRTADRIFDPDTAFDGQNLMLGICAETPDYLTNEEQNIAGFVQNGDLWLYDAAKNSLAEIMVFSEGEDERSNYLQHDIRIIDLDEAGSMHFMVSGYMNRGLHEGETGIAVYYYDAIANTVEERIFLESDEPYDIMHAKLGRLASISSEEHLYICYDGALLDLNLRTRTHSVLAEGLLETDYVVSENRQLLAWQAGDSKATPSKLHLLSVNDGAQHIVTAGDHDAVYALGFMENDLIWGTASLMDAAGDGLGHNIYPMYRIMIQDPEGNPVREFMYSEQGKYVTDFETRDNRIELSCVLKTENGYVETTPEPITYQASDVQTKIVLKATSDQVKKREYRLVFSGRDAEASAPKRLMPKQIIFEGGRDVRIRPTSHPELYYVYARGGMLEACPSIAEAVIAANDAMGLVTDRDNRVVWNRSGRSARAQIGGIVPNPDEESETTMEGSLKLMLAFESIYPDVTAELAMGETPIEVLEKNLTEKVFDLSGCALSTVLYYVDLGKPVLAAMNGQSAVLITGYDSANIIVTDPSRRESYKMGLGDAADHFAAAGNKFVTCINLPQ